MQLMKNKYLIRIYILQFDTESRKKLRDAAQKKKYCQRNGTWNTEGRECSAEIMNKSTRTLSDVSTFQEYFSSGVFCPNGSQ